MLRHLSLHRPAACAIAAVTAFATIVFTTTPASAEITGSNPPGEVITIGPGSRGQHSGAYNPERDEYLHVARDLDTVRATILRSDGTIRVPAFTVVTATGTNSLYRASNIDAVYNPSTNEYLVSYGRRSPRGAAGTTGRIFAHRIDATTGSLGPAVDVDRVVSNDSRCWAERHDIAYDPATGGYVLAYAVAMLFATTDPCEDSSNDHKTTVARLSADLVPGPRTDLPGDLPNGNDTWTAITHNPTTGQFLVGRLDGDGGRYTLLGPDFGVVREQFADVRNATPGSFPSSVFTDVHPTTGDWYAMTRGSQRVQLMVLAADGTVLTPPETRSEQVNNGFAVFADGAIVTVEGFSLGEYDVDGERIDGRRIPGKPGCDLFEARDIIPGANGHAMVAGSFACLSTTEAAAWFVDVRRDRPIQSSAPGRFFDSRPGAPDFDGDGRPAARVAAGATVRLQITNRGDIPSDAAGAVANVTAVNPSAQGFITVWDCAGDPPNASSLNYAPGTVVANELVSKLNTNGELCLFTSAETHLLVDAVGYLPAGSELTPLAPGRFFDSRPGAPDFDGDGRPAARVAAGATVRLDVAPRGDVSEAASAVVANVTAVNPSAQGFITVWDCAGDPPNASSLNYAPGTVVANELVSKLNTNGELCLFTSAETHLLVDVVGSIS